MTTELPVDRVILNGAMYFRERIVGPDDLTGEGVLVLDADAGTHVPLITVEAGTVIHGFSVRIAGEDVTGDTSRGVKWFTIRCASAAGCLFVHESESIVDDEDDRINIIGNATATVGIDERAVQVIYSDTAQRWLFPNWSSPLTPIPFVLPGEVSAVADTRRVVYRGPSRLIAGISLVLDGPFTPASSVTFTPSINGTPITDGAIAVAAADAGAGTVHVSVPSAANTLSDGDVLSVTASGTNMLAATAAVTFLLN